MATLVLTVIGADKPGLVELLSKTIAHHQGNWLESGMSQLAGKFAGIMVTQLPDSEVDELLNALHSLEKQGLKVVAERTDDNSEAQAGRCSFALELVGHDKPGIVRDISQALAARQINVINLKTELVPGPMSSELLFTAEAQLTAPEALDMDDLQQALEAIASDLMVDITLT